MSVLDQVKGQDVVVFINGQPYVCAKSVTLNVATDLIETSVSGSGLWGSFLPTKSSFSGQLDGVVSLSLTGGLTLKDLRALQFAQTIFTLEIKRTSEDGNKYTSSGSFFITGSDDSGSFDGINIFTITLQGTGPLTETEHVS